VLLVVPAVRSPIKGEAPQPKLDVGALAKRSPSDYLTRFAFGAGISAAAAVAGLVFGVKLGGVLLAFPAVLPAALTLIERKDGRHEAAVDATGAILGAFAMIGFALTAAWALPRFSAGIAVALSGAAWLAIAATLYVLIVWLPRRRKRPVKIARPSST
jgi:hypothetical protein